jgi:hypothetical protein
LRNLLLEDDPIQLEDPTYEDGANTVSLVEAQENFKEFGACEREMISYVRKPTENEFLTKYFYEKLIMSLITMSLPAEEQKYMIGIGCTGDEILEDFSNFYVERRQFYIDNKVLTNKQIGMFDEFDRLLDKYGEHDEDFYGDIEQLKNNPLWEELRVQAKIVITQVFGKKFKIDIKRKNELVDGKFIEHTRRILKEEDDFCCGLFRCKSIKAIMLHSTLTTEKKKL